MQRRGAFSLKPALIIFVAVGAFLIVLNFGIRPAEQESNRNSLIRNTGRATCAEDAKVCPDGSTVIRTGPNCAFAACPTTNSTNRTNDANENTNAEANPTTGWKTYTDTALSVRFLYPPQYSVSKSDSTIWINPQRTGVDALLSIQKLTGTIASVEQELRQEYTDPGLNDGTPTAATDDVVAGRTARRLTFGTAIGLTDVNYLIEWDGSVLQVKFAETLDAPQFEAIVDSTENA